MMMMGLGEADDSVSFSSLDVNYAVLQIFGSTLSVWIFMISCQSDSILLPWLK